MAGPDLLSTPSRAESAHMTYDPYPGRNPNQPPPPGPYQQQGGPYQQQQGAPYQHYGQPYQQQDAYPPQDYQQPPPSRRPERQEGEGVDTAIRIVRTVTAIATTIFVLHILFVVFDANQGNEFVSFVYTMAKALVLGLGDVFTPDDAEIGVVLNYGFAALLYFIIGQFVIKMLRRP